MSMGSRKRKNVRVKGKVILEIMTEGFDHFNDVSLYYSQDTWRKQIKRKSGRDIGRRQLNYDFKDLQEMGIIKRFRRHLYDKRRGYIFRSTRYYVDIYGWKMAAFFKITSWKRAWKMIAGIKKGAQAKINKPKGWVAPAWMKEFMGQKEELNPVPDG